MNNFLNTLVYELFPKHISLYTISLTHYSMDYFLNTLVYELFPKHITLRTIS